MRFTERVAELDEERRLHLYELLAHNLTVAIRCVWSDESIGAAEKVERIKWINEILHTATAKVWALRLRTHTWSEEDFGAIVRDYVEKHEGIEEVVRWAVHSSYRTVCGEEMG